MSKIRNRNARGKLGISLFLINIICSTQILYAQGAGQALDFDGTDDYINSGKDTSLNIRNAITLEAWINIDTQLPQSDYFDIIGKGDYGMYVLGINGGTDMILAGYFYIDGGEVDMWSKSTIDISINTWTHLVVTFDGTDMKGYVNGILDFTHNNPGTIDNSSAVDLTFGVWTPPADYFSGTIDEVSIWNVAHTQTQIRDNMCQRLTGSETGLVGYWRFDKGSYTTVDVSDNSNTATLGTATEGDDAEPSWILSGAAIGDASAYDYAGSSAADFSVNLAANAGDDITATGTSGTFTGLQVYRVDAEPNVTTPPSGWSTLSDQSYYGMFTVGSSTPTYTVTYNYDGHIGISNESALKLAYRSDNSATAWTDLSAILDTEANTLTKTGQTSTEYILGSTSSDNSLPVELTIWNVTCLSGMAVLSWTTESEIDNLGYLIFRLMVSDEKNNAEWKLIDSYQSNPILRGQGSVTFQTEYSYIDKSVEAGNTYQYQLADVDINGKETYHTVRTVMVYPVGVVLSKAYPNPFNPYTQFSITVDVYSPVSISIYNLKGRLVATIAEESLYPGEYFYMWDGQTSTGQMAASGIYFVNMSVKNSIESVQKVLLVR